jgi:hypothetical protein
MIQEYFRSSSLGQAAQDYNGEMNERMLEVVGFSQWVHRLAEGGKRKDVDLVKNPGLKLLEFYQSLDHPSGRGSRLATTETCKESETMRSLKVVDCAWMRLWLDQWGF